jgi:putative oxidoreductase
MARGSLVVTARFCPAYRRTTNALNNLGWLPNLVLRLTVGFMFLSSAVGKLGDLGKFTAMFVSLGIPAAQVLAPVTAVVELVGGAALMLGLGTRLVSLILAGDVVGALITDIGPNLAQKHADLWDFLSNLFYAPEWHAGRAAAVATVRRCRQGQLGRANRSTFGGADHRGLTHGYQTRG